MERWTPNLEDENEPRATIQAGEREFLIHRGNTRLYHFLGGLAMYNHVHYSDKETAFYVFDFVNGYDQLATFVTENNFTAYVNQTEVPQCDIDAYNAALEKTFQALDGVPEDW